MHRPTQKPPTPTPLPEWVVNVDPRHHGYTSYTDRSMEREQLHASIEVTPENADYMYSLYSEPKVNYQRGTRPLLETIVDRVCADCTTDLEKAVALVTWRRANYVHLGKCGLGSEEEIILGGYSMCHDASRCLIILAQVAGLGSRMIIGLNNVIPSGHTLTEICIDGQWVVFDPSPTLGWAYLVLPDGSLVNGWDLHQDPAIMERCIVHRPGPLTVTPAHYASFFGNYRLVNYTLEESARFMAQRFLRLAAAHQALANYDYQGHLIQQRFGAFVDFEESISNWVDATLGNCPKP